MSQSKQLPVVADCEGCGVCCFHMGYPTYMEPFEESYDAVYWNAMPADLKRELLDVMAQYKSPGENELDGPCFWLDMETRQCKHHQYRPRVCRDFEVGSQGCLDWRKHYQEFVPDS